MTLRAGTSVGTYEIADTLGAGGMGTVYRARDARLGRDVAIKVLAPGLAADGDFRARFEREARTLAALSHPNIAAVFGMVDFPADGTTQAALIMELVEGESLDERIARARALPMREALRIARQIAEALEAAHDRGIVHRDLKPANVRVTPSGQVKILDFGLAKMLGLDSTAAAGAHTLQTMTSGGTALGVVMGTAAYMSPEQARGLAVDRRADVWAFGCVLYEMLAGTRPFAGATVSDSIAALLTRSPDWTRLPGDTPAGVRRVLKRSLEKDPALRLRDIADARFDLDGDGEVDGGPAAGTRPPAAPRTARTAVRRAAGIAALIAAASGVTAWAVWRSRPIAPAAPVTRFSIAIDPLHFKGTQRAVLALSPDGRMLAFSGGTPLALYVRPMDALEAHIVRGSEGDLPPTGPVFSPDGQSLVYWTSSDQTLRRISVDGGAPLTLCQTELPSGVSWSADGIVFANTEGIYRVSPGGGGPELLVKAAGGEIAFFPQLLPGGHALLFTATDSAGGSERWDTGHIVLQSPGKNDRRTLIDGGTDARYAASGHIIFARAGIVYAAPFDLQTLSLTGREAPVIEGVMRGTGTYGSGTVNLALSTSGTLAYLPGPITPIATKSAMSLFDFAGNPQPLPIAPGSYQSPRASPDGHHVAFVVDDGRDVNVWVYDLGTDRAPRRLTFGGRNRTPVWSADSQRVAYRSDRDGATAIYWQRADGTGAAERLTTPPASSYDTPASFSPDGGWLLFDRVAAGRAVLSQLSLRDRRVSRFGSVETSNWTGAVFSPDGRWVAYATRERGKSNQIFIEPFPATGAKYLLSSSTEDAHHPVWGAHGTEIFYTPGPGNRTTAVPVTFTPSLSFGVPRALDRPFSNLASTSDRPYDLMPDGRHFLSVTDPLSVDTAVHNIVVVLNWFDELKTHKP